MRFVIDCVTLIAFFARTCIFQWWGFDMGMAAYWSPQESWIPSPRHPRRMQLICVSFPVRAPRGWLRHPSHPFMSSQVNLSYHVLRLMWSWHSSCHPCFSKSLHKGHQHGSWTSDKGGDWIWFSRGKPRPIGRPSNSNGIPTSNIQKRPWTMAPWSRFATGGSQPESFQSQRQDVWKETWSIYQ